MRSKLLLLSFGLLLFSEAVDADEISHGDLTSQNAFQRMNLSPDATAAEIKKRYRELAIKYHPDRAPPGFEEIYTETFKKISEANECLTHPKCKGSGDIKAFKQGKHGRASSYQAESSPAFDIKQGQYPFQFLSETDETTHLARVEKFRELDGQFRTQAEMPPQHPLQNPAVFKKYRSAFTSSDFSRRSAWISMLESIDETVANPAEARITADAFTVIMVRRTDLKYLTDLTDAQMVKTFQLLYTSEPRIAWMTLIEKIKMSAIVDPDQANRLVLFALANANPENEMDQNAISKVFNSYAQQVHEIQLNRISRLREIAEIWDIGRVIESQLTADGLKKLFSEFTDSRYTMNRFYRGNEVTEKRVLGAVMNSLESLNQYSSRAYLNFSQYLKANEAMLRPNWQQKLVKIGPPKVITATASRGIFRQGLSQIDSLEAYFASVTAQRSGFFQCLKILWGR